MEYTWRIELLGSFRLVQPGRELSRFKTRKTGSLLAYLACRLGVPIPREILIETFWPGRDPDAGRQSLSQALSSLRHQLEPPGFPRGVVFSADRESIRCDPTTVTTDLSEFERCLREAARRPEGPNHALLLQRALGLYRGELLPGLYDDWVLSERTRIAGAFSQSALWLLRHLEQRDDHAAALEVGRTLVRHDPWSDEGHRAVIRLLTETGEGAAAWSHFEQWRRALWREMRMEPDAETVRLAQAARERSGPAPTDVHRYDRKAPTRPVRATAHRRWKPASTQPPTAFRSGTLTLLAGDRVAGETAPTIAQGSKPSPAHPGRRPLLSRPLRTEVERIGGWFVERRADRFVAAFPRAADAMAIAVAVWRNHLAHPGTATAEVGLIRLALHSGDAAGTGVDPEDLVPARAGRLLLMTPAAQILCTQVTAELLPRTGDPGFELQELGLYFLLDESAPERLVRVVPSEQSAEDLPPPRARQVGSGNLPPPMTRFFGRDAELASLADRLDTARDPLTTLTGPGGTGKSRLAVELGGRLASRFAGGVWFVPLADVTQPDRIPEAILGSLRARRDPGLEPAPQIASLLGPQRSLLVLDNFEQLLPAGAPIVREILTACPTVQCLVTSRRPLGLEGECEFPVCPLAIPEGSPAFEALCGAPSVQLFIDRAQAVRPDFQITRGNAGAIQRICAGLDGIPLAIELAAARVQVLTPRQMVDRLGHRLDLLVSRRRDLTARHRTLRDALHWSCRLLSPELRRFFADLSIFDGSWTADAAEAVCAEPLALDALAQLRDASLVQSFEAAEEMRFRMLDTVREYAREQLPAEREAELSDRFADFYLRLAEEADPKLRSRDRLVCLDRLALENQNFERALRWWASAAGPPASPVPADGSDRRAAEGLLRLVVALSTFWQVRGHLRDGREWLRQALARCREDDVTPLRARALDEAACLAFLQGDLASAEPSLDQSLQTYRAAGDRAGEATVRMDLGNLALVRGQFAAARGHYEQALVIRRERDDRQGVARCLHNFGNLAKAEGDLDTARSLLEESLLIKQGFDDPWDVASTRQSLGDVAAIREDAETARAHYEACLAIRRQVGDRQGVAFVLGNLALVVGAQGDLEGSTKLLRESLVLKRDLGDRRGISGSLLNLGSLALRGGDAVRAARLFAAASAIHAAIGFRLPPGEQKRYDDRLSEARAALSPQTFDAATATGRLMSEIEAIDYAMGS